MWTVQPMEIAGPSGEHTGRWRMTATSDEGGGGPIGDDSHDHGSAKEAQECDQCDDYCSRMSGFPSKKAMRENSETHRLSALLTECRSSVRLDLDNYERVLNEMERSDQQTSATYDAVSKERTRLFRLLNQIDELKI